MFQPSQNVRLKFLLELAIPCRGQSIAWNALSKANTGELFFLVGGIVELVGIWEEVGLGVSCEMRYIES